MKLQTEILPRRDGKLTVKALDGETLVFEKDAAGILTGEVSDPATLEHLLRTGNFYPANEGDFQAAEALIAQPDPDADDEGDDDDFDGDEDAPLLDANTPPKPARAKPGPKPKTKG